MPFKKLFALVVCSVSFTLCAQDPDSYTQASDSMELRFQSNTHTVVLDEQGKIIPWNGPPETAYDNFVRQRWNFIKTKTPNSPGPAPRSDYPMYYFYCAFRDKGGELIPDTWMNDIGEKIPNWFESARLYYAYTGDSSVMKIVEDFADYTLNHGLSPGNFSWPHFPYTTTNAGDTEFRGFTSAQRFVLHEIQVDHAAEMGLAYYRLYQYNGKAKFRDAAIRIANTLAAKISPGTLTHSPWPYRIVMDDGKVTSAYGANWTGAYMLFDHLVTDKAGSFKQYARAQKIVKDFLMTYPAKTGYWTDGHSDTQVNSHTYKSNLSASNYKLFLFDYPEFDPQWKEHMPQLIKWTEDNFVDRGVNGEPGHMWGANIVGEQDDFLVKMDYQTARYAAECARWYSITKDPSFKEKAYRSLNWVTYCNDADGQAFESPLSKDVSNWWSDCYGEGPRMFYHVFAAMPEWTPPNEDHILYSASVLKDVNYKEGHVSYTTTTTKGIEYAKLSFVPASIKVGDVVLSKTADPSKEGYQIRTLEQGDYAVTIQRRNKGRVVLSEK